MDGRRIELVREELERQAHSMTGELMFGHLIEAAKTLLADLNYPEGDCPICLEPLCSPPSTQQAQTLERLPCYHSLHR